MAHDWTENREAGEDNTAGGEDRNFPLGTSGCQCEISCVSGERKDVLVGLSQIANLRG